MRLQKKYIYIYSYVSKKMRDTGWQHLGREDQDVNYKLATGDHPDLGLEGLVLKEARKVFSKYYYYIKTPCGHRRH